MQQVDATDPPYSRLFIVCGKSVEADVLQAAFKPFGNVQNVKVVRDKGVAYVKYDKASSAAKAIEELNGEVLNNGRGPKLKVLVADNPTTRAQLQQPPPLQRSPDQELSSDPDNVPPRSRLFLVVPKTADATLIQDELCKYENMEYCKTDLIAPKGVVFAKFGKASSALLALEDIAEKGTVAGYKVKVMLAEPKTKRVRNDTSPGGAIYTPAGQAAKLEYAMNSIPMDAGGGYRLGAGPQAMFNYGGAFPFNDRNGSMTPQPLNVHDYSSISGLAGMPGGIPGMQGMPNLGSIGSGMDSLGQQVGRQTGEEVGFNPVGQINLITHGGSNTPDAAAAVNMASGLNFNPTSNAATLGNSSGLSSSFSGLNTFNLTSGPLAQATSPPLSKQRLFVVVHKGVSEDMLARLFRRFPGMEYCDLKKDRTTGKSKGYCYINYSTQEAAAMAIDQLNGVEFPPGSGHCIKVMYAEPLGVRNISAKSLPMPAPSAMSPIETPFINRKISSEVQAVQDSLSQMTLSRVDSHGGDTPLHEVNGHRRMTSPVPSVARELMFSNVNEQF